MIPNIYELKDVGMLQQYYSDGLALQEALSSIARYDRPATDPADMLRFVGRLYGDMCGLMVFAGARDGMSFRWWWPEWLVAYSSGSLTHVYLDPSSPKMVRHVCASRLLENCCLFSRP